MQIRSGQAKVLSANHRRVQFVGMSAADAAALASGQEFKFEDETLLYFVIATVISAVPATAEIELTEDYNGAHAFDVLAPYAITKDYTPNRGYKEIAPGDVDIRDAITDNFRQLDAEVQDLYDNGGGGGGGQGLTADAVLSVAEGATSRTITAAELGLTNLPTPPYTVFVDKNWFALHKIHSKTTGQFTVDFNSPAPSGAEINVGVV